MENVEDIKSSLAQSLAATRPRSEQRLRCTLLCLVGLCITSSQARVGAPAPGPETDVAAAAAAAAPVAAATQSEIRTLQPFHRVAICAPFTVLVEPAALYQLTIEAEATVRSAITTLVDEGTLLVEASTFSTNVPIKVTAGLPAGALTAVTNRGAFPGIVAPGFNASRLTLNGQGTSQLTVLGLTVETLVVGSTGTGATVVTGTIKNAQISTSATGAVFVTGVSGSAVVTSTGTGNVYLNTSSGAQITGTSTGLGKVVYPQGACSVQSNTPSFVFGPPCQQGAFALPDTSASWTCGVQMTGRYACAGGSSTVAPTNAACPPAPVALPPAPGGVSSYSLIDSKVGTLLGLDTNTPQAMPPAYVGSAVASGTGSSG